MSSDWAGRYLFLVSSADPDATEVWVDFTDRVRDVQQVMEAHFGRQNDLEQVEPAAFVVQFDNDDDALTFGNTTSPYTSWWGPGRKCQLRETVAGTTFNVYTGYIQTPTEVVITATGTDAQQRVSVDAMDRLGRLASTPPFPSTVAAHVLGSVRNGALVGYWPLLEDAQPFADTVGSTVVRSVDAGSTVPSVEQAAAVLPGEGAELPGDDAAPVLLRPGLSAAAIAQYYAVEVFGWPPYPSLAAGQVLTVVAWINAKSDYPTGGSWDALALTHFDGLVVVQKVDDPAGDYFRVTSPLGTLTGNVSGAVGSAAATDRYYMLGLRFGFTPNVLELWIDDAIYTATLSGVLAGPLSISQLDAVAIGSIAHLQLYMGAAADFTNADFLAQRAVGLSGLERQTTGARVRSVLAYAGVPSVEYASTVDAGTTVMAKAQLAGKNPLAALREAEATEQGLLYVDGSGQVIFKDRRTLYNV